MQNKLLIRDFVLEKLSHLSPYYYYHNLDHTLYVVNQCNIIGKHCDCTNEELELLEIAALWHDTGFLETYYNHEQASCAMARKYLPQFDCSDDDIETICTTIMATKIPQTPTNRLGEILADADLEYLGTDAATDRANALFHEIKHIKPSITPEEWNHIQIDFLKIHRYFTDYCKTNKQPGKDKFLSTIVESL